MTLRKPTAGKEFLLVSYFCSWGLIKEDPRDS
jgi:hypothetical protein